MKKSNKTEKVVSETSQSEEKILSENVKKVSGRKSIPDENTGSSSRKPLEKKQNKGWISRRRGVFVVMLILVIVVFGGVTSYQDEIKDFLSPYLANLISDGSQKTEVEIAESVIHEEARTDVRESPSKDTKTYERSARSPDERKKNLNNNDDYGERFPMVQQDEKKPESMEEKIEDTEVPIVEEPIKDAEEVYVSKNKEILNVSNIESLEVIKKLHQIIVELESIKFLEQSNIKNENRPSHGQTDQQTFSEKILQQMKGLIQIRKIESDEKLMNDIEVKYSLKNQVVMNLVSGKIMLLAGFYSESLDDIKRARKIFNRIYDLKEKNGTLLIERLDQIINQLEEIDR
tara:strand:- start:1467 stop:2504 length:1038 start_codon:yes stop_codon:yes gene_type:complete